MRVWRIATFHQALFYMQDRCHLHQALLGGQVIVPSSRSQSNFTYCVICSSSEPCHLDPEDAFFAPVIYKLAKWCTFVYHTLSWDLQWVLYQLPPLCAFLLIPQSVGMMWAGPGCSSMPHPRDFVSFSRNAMHCQFLQHRVWAVGW